jgi:hypothetical protein
MAINKVDINLSTALNEDNVDGTYGTFIPKNRYTEFSDYLSQNLNTYEKNVGVKNPRCKVVGILDTTGNKPQVASYSWTRSDTQGLSTDTMRIIQVKVICPNGPRSIVPYPSDVVNSNIENQDPFIKSLHTTAFLEFDSSKVQVQLALLDEVIIEYIGNDKSEAKILEVFRINNRTAQSSEPNPQTAFGGSDGTTLADANSNTTGDVNQKVSNNAPSNTSNKKCGIKDNKKYPLQDCTSAKLDANGQIATLHPVYWNKINDLLNKIKQNENYTIKVGESIRSKESQLAARKRRCPAALQKKGEEWLKTARWSEVLKNGPCVDATPTGAVEGAYASNHLKGLAVDFTMDVGCPASNVNRASYDRCRSVSRVFTLLNKYANEFEVQNLITEPWHWSSNGG